MAKPMSMKERAGLATKSFASPPVDSGLPVSRVIGDIRSGPAHAILAMHADAEVANENKQLRKELEVWRDATPARLLDPTTVSPSRWANRHEDSFAGSEFLALKTDIELAGGNVQAIKVRPTEGEGIAKFEIVFGHRRHRACLELGLPVLALIAELSEQDLFVEMDRENRQRADLTPYEQGEMYRRALDDGLYPSLRRMADALGVAHSSVSRTLSIARLPAEVLDAFPSRLEVQYRWCEPLTEALTRDEAAVTSKAKEFLKARLAGQGVSAKGVFEGLVGTVRGESKRRDVMAGDKVAFSVKESRGKVAFEVSAVSPAKLKAIEAFILKTLAS